MKYVGILTKCPHTAGGRSRRGSAKASTTVDMLDKIQRKATKLIPELRDLTYEERLKECGLTTLETRRIRGDQIEVFKILNGYENIDSNIFFEIKESKITRARGHNYTLVKKQSRLDVRKFSFSQRTINVWNNLSTDCVHASTVEPLTNDHPHQRPSLSYDHSDGQGILCVYESLTSDHPSYTTTPM